MVQPSDNFTSIASKFGATVSSLTALNGDRVKTYESVFVPVSELPQLIQPSVVPSVPSDDKEGVNKGLAIGLGICGALLILVFGVWVYRERLLKKRRKGFGRDLQSYKEVYGGGKIVMPKEEVNLMADVSGCLDKYRVFGIEELREATNGFDQSCLIHGSVYKGIVDGEVFAIKKMKWNAREELKILQKVNHGNLVRLEGFCIDPEDANCYLVYEFVENGSLYAWLHKNKHRKLTWKTRLRIAVDVANGLQYIHEHTRPRVVHKDIKSSNILLDGNMRAKIANFGLAKSGCNAITMHIVGTQGYIAPEYLADGVVSTKMDVFSFGVVLLELVSGREAIDEQGRNLWVCAGTILDGEDLEKERRLMDWMDRSLLEQSFSMESVMNVMSVAVACVNRDPSKRPSMVDIVYALSKSDDLFFDISDDAISDTTVSAR